MSEHVGATERRETAEEETVPVSRDRHIMPGRAGDPPPPGTLAIAYCGALFRLRGPLHPFDRPLPPGICPLCAMERAAQAGEVA